MAEHVDATNELTKPPADAAATAAEVSSASTASDDPVESVVMFRVSTIATTLVVGLLIATILAGLAGWIGYRAHQARQAQALDELFVEAARQTATALTTIRYSDAEADIKRILDSSTGRFHDDFQSRSQPFIDVVVQSQSKSVGTITAAALESRTNEEGHVLVTVAVKSSNAAGDDEPPRAWRMRLGVLGTDHGAKVFDVAFVR